MRASRITLSSPRAANERGVALVLVIFVVALATIVVVNMAYSTNLSARMNSMVQRSVQAEYLLKSAMNFGRVLLKNDQSQEDGVQDDWGKFSSGVLIPPELLGISEPNIRVYVEIRPEDSKIRLSQLVPVSSGAPDKRWQGVLTRLFRNLGFDNDEREEDTTGYFPGRHFNAEELVAHLIDYMDSDRDSVSPGGIEAELPENYFPNAPIKRIEELSLIPGFTPNRIRKLAPFITTYGQGRVNINLAPAIVIKSLHESIDDAQVQKIIEFRESEQGPFRYENLKEELTKIIDDDIYENVETGISILIVAGSSWFQVLSKVDYGTASFFMRSFVTRPSLNALPEIVSIELF